MKKARIFIKPLLVLCAILCALIGVLLLNTNKKVTAKADTVQTFSMVDGAAISVKPENAYMRFTVNITQEMYDNLMEPTKKGKFLWWTTYNPDNTYLTLYRCEIGHNGENLDYTSDAEFRFHNDPEHSDETASLLEFDPSNNLKVYLKVPMPADWDVEYQYVCVYEQYDLDDFVAGETSPFQELGRATNTVTRSVENIAKAVLEDEVAADPNKYSEDEVTWFKHLAGIEASGENFNVNLVYEKILGYGNIKTITETYQARSIFWKNGDLVASDVFNAAGIKGISDFNCVYIDATFQKVIRVAQGVEYVAPETADGVGMLKVIYRSFDYSDFAIRVQDNNTTDNANLYLYHYATQENWSWDEDLDIAYLTFYYSDIKAQAHSALSWIFDVKASNVDVPNGSNKTVFVTKTDDKVQLSFRRENVEDLKNVSILITAEIVTDREILLDINYSKLSYENGEILEEELTDTYSIMLSEYMQISQWFTFKDSSYMKMVSDAVELKALNGKSYFIPSGVHGMTVDNDSTKFTLNIEYEYQALFKVFKGKAEPYFIACDKNSATYTYEDLLLNQISSDYRLASLTSDGTAVTIRFSEGEWQKAAVTLNFLSSEKRIIPIYATYTDKWNLVIEYMQNYKKTPFAEKTISEVQIKVSDYDIEKLTSDDISEILNVNGITMDKVIANVSIPDKKVSTEFTDDSTYTAKVTYGLAAIRQIDYNGNVREIRIPLTSFSDWCSSFGEEWSILFLNSYGKMHFQYSNEVAREDLYGFFSVAVFQERVSDLNYWFRNTTGDGQIVIFENKEVKGSKIYQFFGSLKDNIFTSGLGHVGMFFCELFDKDAGTYHSYFFYLDGSTKNGYISNGGADNAYDTDGALENKVEDFGDWIEDNIVDFFFTILIAIAVAFIIVWLLSLLKDFLKKLLK